MSQFTILSKNRPTHPFSETLQLISGQTDAVQTLEEAFADKVQGRYAIAFPHCRVAVRAILESTNIPGTQVALTAYTCVVIPHSVVLANKKPVFVDIDRASFNTPVGALLKNSGPDTQALLTTSMYGNPLDFSVLEQKVTRPILVVEDNALSVHPTAKFQNPLIQAASVYSLDFNKPLSALYGGMAVTNDLALAERLRAWRKQNLKKPNLRFEFIYFLKFVAAQFAFRPLGYTAFERIRRLKFIDRVVDTRFMDAPGYPPTANWEFSPLQSKVTLSQLERCDEFLARR